jgi:hypothetical protein
VSNTLAYYSGKSIAAIKKFYTTGLRKSKLRLTFFSSAPITAKKKFLHFLVLNIIGRKDIYSLGQYYKHFTAVIIGIKLKRLIMLWLVQKLVDKFCFSLVGPFYFLTRRVANAFCIMGKWL